MEILYSARTGLEYVALEAELAAAAAEHGGLAVLHRDAHFPRLAQTLSFDSVMLPGA